jgi:hypothetical protein
VYATAKYERDTIFGTRNVRNICKKGSDLASLRKGLISIGEKEKVLIHVK